MRILVTPTLVLSCLLFAACGGKQEPVDPPPSGGTPESARPETPPEVPAAAEPAPEPATEPAPEAYSGPTETVVLDVTGMS